MRYVEEERPSLIGRCIGALMASTFAALTTVAIPWLLVWKFPIKLGVIFPLLKVFALYGFYFWITIVATAAFVIGYVYGGYAVLDIFNLIWGTGETNDSEIKETAHHLRGFIPITIIVSFVLIIMSRI